jgi:predicted nuclease with RNAse H fold
MKIVQWKPCIFLANNRDIQGNYYKEIYPTKASLRTSENQREKFEKKKILIKKHEHDYRLKAITGKTIIKT